MRRLPPRTTRRSYGRPSSKSDAVALAKMRVVEKMVDSIGDLAQGMGFGASSYPTSSDIGGSPSGLVLDTAHRGASQNDRALLSWGVASPVDPNLETVYDLPALRSRSRDLIRNNPIAQGAVNLPTLNVIGSGLTLHPVIDREYLQMDDEAADQLETNIKRWFDAWALSTDADLRRTENFYGLQELGFRSVLSSGEIFVTLPLVKRPGTLSDLRVKLIEGDRISNPMLIYDTLWRMAGIEVDTDGAPLAYWIETTPTWLNVTRTWERAEAWGAKSGRPNVLHIYKQQRPGDKRGVPMLSPVIETLKQISRYSEAELMAAVVAAMFTVFIKSLAGEDDMLQAAIPNPAIPSAPGPDESAPNDLKTVPLGNGSVISLAEGEDISIANPGRPNAMYEPFVDAHLRQIGMAIGIPYEVLTQHFSSSYSASRAALLEVWRMYDERRFWFATRFCQPIYEEWLAEMVLAGRIGCPGFFDDEMVRRAYCGAEWIGTSPGQLDPVKETNAATMRVNAGFSTIERESRGLNGTNYKRNFTQRSKEEKERKALGLDFTTNINPITGEDDGRTETIDAEGEKPGQSGDSDTK